MKLAQNLPLHQELVPGSPGLGHIRRAMTPQDMTDGGIAERIHSAVQQGMISPEAAGYLLDDMLGDGGQTKLARQLRRMSMPKAMPAVSDTIPYGWNLPMGSE